MFLLDQTRTSTKLVNSIMMAKVPPPLEELDTTTRPVKKKKEKEKLYNKIVLVMPSSSRE